MTWRETRRRVKEVLCRSQWALSAGYIADDLLWGARLAANRRETGSGTIHSHLSLEESLAYIELVFADYKRYGGIEVFEGRVCELGPGDNAGVALLMRADGCEVVDLVDRFRSQRSPAHQGAIYQALIARHPRARLWTGAPGDDRSFDGIRWVSGVAAEEHFQHPARAEQYDFIVSRSVMEHVYHPLGCLGAMVRALRPSGKMVHRVDLRDHGMFTHVHPLKFLEVPTGLYRRMTRFSGRPNRILVHRYLELLERLRRTAGIEYTLQVTDLVEVGPLPSPQPLPAIDSVLAAPAVRFVERHRAAFVKEFREVAPLELAVTGFFLTVARKAHV
jgi:SAM-dependent methyltransferase